jgi:Flp pilus assembly protein TadD
MGLVGLVIVLIMFLSWRKVEIGKFDWWMGVVLGIITLVMPLSLPLWALWWWQAMMKDSKVKEVEPKVIVGEEKNVMPLMIMTMIVLLVGAGGWWLGRILLGELWMRKSLLSASKNEAVPTYESQIKAIGYNPWAADYRRIYSQTNMAMTQALLSKKEISEDDKGRASTLLQQAVREAKAAAALESTNAVTWNNLASIYRLMAGTVEGAPDWAFQAYNQAIQLDPNNAMLKMDLGGLLFAAGRYEDADRVFEQAVSVKPDYANSWYNWAHTAKKMNKLADAVARLEQSLTLVRADSGDYEKASEELVTWKKELDEAIKKQQEALKQQQQAAEEKKAETLKTPEPIPTVKDKIEVPADVKPDISVVPTQVPSVSPSAVTPTKAN